MKSFFVILFFFISIFSTNHTLAKKPLKKYAQYTGEAIIDYDVMFSAGGFFKLLNKCEDGLGKEYRLKIGSLSWQDFVNYNKGLSKFTSSIWKVDRCNKGEINEIIDWYEQIISRIEDELNVKNNKKNNQLSISNSNKSINTYNISDYECIFNWNEFGSENFSQILPELYSNITFNLDLTTNNKLDWKITKINFPNSFKNDLSNLFETEKKILEKIIYNKKLTRDEKYMLSLIASYLDISVEEINVEIKKLTNKEIKELLKTYDNEIDKVKLAFDIFNINQRDYLNDIKNSINSLSNISSKNDNIHIEVVLDTGISLKNTINYSKIINNDLSEVMKIGISLLDGTYLGFIGDCSSNNFFIDSDINNNQDIETKLRKLKSLFQNKLITKKEYDDKRLEILDDM